MRLIDADKLIAFIDAGKYCSPNVLTFSENDVCEMINNQPTAYYVDKVVEELEESSIEFEVFGRCSEFVNSAIAIDIVKRGGVE